MLSFGGWTSRQKNGGNACVQYFCVCTCFFCLRGEVLIFFVCSLKTQQPMAGLLNRVYSGISSALDFNQSTLSGAVDLIVIRNGDEYKSTPFHVRFGKLQVLKADAKKV